MKRGSNLSASESVRRRSCKSPAARSMPVGMAHDDSVNTDISLLDEVRIQARVLIPVLRALRTELGEE